MADKYQHTGSWGTTPQTGALLSNGAPAMTAPINETVTLAQKNFDDYDLVVDTPVAVAFGGCATAAVVNIFSDRKVLVRLTSADGVQQSVPCDGSLMITSRSVPFTAVDLTRVAGQETRAKVFLGQKSA